MPTSRPLAVCMKVLLPAPVTPMTAMRTLGFAMMFRIVSLMLLSLCYNVTYFEKCCLPAQRYTTIRCNANRVVRCSHDVRGKGWIALVQQFNTIALPQTLMCSWQTECVLGPVKSMFLISNVHVARAMCISETPRYAIFLLLGRNSSSTGERYGK